MNWHEINSSMSAGMMPSIIAGTWSVVLVDEWIFCTPHLFLRLFSMLPPVLHETSEAVLAVKTSVIDVYVVTCKMWVRIERKTWRRRLVATFWNMNLFYIATSHTTNIACWTNSLLKLYYVLKFCYHHVTSSLARKTDRNVFKTKEIKSWKFYNICLAIM